MIRNVPREGVLLEDVGQPGLVGEEQGQVGGQNAVLDVAQDLSILVMIQLGKDVVVFLRQIKGKPLSATHLGKAFLPVAE